MSRRRIGAGLALTAAALATSPAMATPPGHNGLIVWQRATPKTFPRLWVANPDGTGARQVFKGTANQGEFEGTFSPTDPNAFFFSRGADRPFSEDLLRGDLATGAVTRIAKPNSAEIAPTVSPDGTKLAYFAVPRAPLGPHKPPPPQRIVISNLDGSQRHAITPRSVFAVDPDWSPDGTRIVYSEIRPLRDTAQTRLAMVNPDGTGRHTLTPYGGADELNPKFAPDGRTIIFERAKQTGRNSAVMAMPAAGGAARVIYDTRAWDTNPIPSPDGTRILFTSDKDRPHKERINNGFELYTMATDGTDVVRLTNNRKTDFFPDWQRLP